MKIKEKPEDFKVYEIPSLSLTPKGPYAIFRLTKKNWNTEGAVQAICREAGIPRKNADYSGSKDKRAVTEQYISFPASAKGKLEKVDLKGIKLEYAGRASSPINLGDHSGNRFEIAVREVEEKPNRISRMLNLFGEQRFSENNAEVGKAMVTGDFEKACGLMDHREVKSYLEGNPNDYVGAIKKLPEKTASMYVHAYQSLLWNRAAKELAGSENINVPIVGFGTEFDSPVVEEVYRSTMEEEGVSKKDFAIRSIPHLSAEGSDRMLYAPLEDLKIEKKEYGYLVSFSLPSGSYATEALRQIFSG